MNDDKVTDVGFEQGSREDAVVGHHPKWLAGAYIDITPGRFQLDFDDGPRRVYIFELVVVEDVVDNDLGLGRRLAQVRRSHHSRC